MDAIRASVLEVGETLEKLTPPTQESLQALYVCMQSVARHVDPADGDRRGRKEVQVSDIPVTLDVKRHAVPRFDRQSGKRAATLAISASGLQLDGASSDRTLELWWREQDEGPVFELRGTRPYYTEEQVQRLLGLFEASQVPASA